ncbi:MAG TPA: peptidase [Microbacteriaceae bacterium]
MINWISLVVVALAAISSACLIVVLYSLGLRLLSTAGRTPLAIPAEFTDAITIVTPAEAAAEAKRIRKAAKRNPLSVTQQRLALVGAYTCFILCVAAVLFGIYLIIPAFHH